MVLLLITSLGTSPKRIKQNYFNPASNNLVLLIVQYVRKVVQRAVLLFITSSAHTDSITLFLVITMISKNSKMSKQDIASKKKHVNFNKLLTYTIDEHQKFHKSIT
jgi:hypothetical protein